ncbi:MAG: nicotinate-nucleotide diphosphorylase (carboxylating), partial [Dehalococcoidia bacterium]
MKIERSQYEQVVQYALSEDRSRDDITTGVLIPPELKGIARIIAKENGTLAGTEIAAYIFHEIDASLNVQVLIYDGSL